MKEIDWSEAPEGAEYAAFRNNEPKICWYKNVTGSSYDFLYDEGNAWQGRHGTPCHEPLIDRPTQWQGPQDGLPPVGVECKMKHPGSGGWVRVLYLGVYETPWGDTGEAVIVKCAKLFPEDSDHIAPVNVNHELQFRPIQSERDKLVAEGMVAIDAEQPDVCSVEGVVLRMIMAGYRKPMSRAEAKSALLANCPNPFISLWADEALDALGYKEPSQ